MVALPAPARCVLLVTDEHTEALRLALEPMLQRYREATGFAGSFWIEIHLVLRPKPIEVRTAMVTQVARQTADLVVWPTRLADVGQGLKAFLERAQGREEGSMSYGTLSLVSAPLAVRPIYQSDLYVVVPE